MTEQEIIAMLDNLADLRSRRGLLLREKEAAITAIIPPEVQVAIAEIEDDYASQIVTTTGAIRGLETTIKKAIIKHGHDVTGQSLRATTTTRHSWNNKRLQNYAVDHPEAWTFCKKTRTVAIRQRRG